MKRHPKPSDELLDHDADGIHEFDNALPRWWLYGFYFTILWAAVYLVNYHLLPRPLVGFASIAAEYQADVDAAAHRASGRRPSASGVALTALTDPESLDKGRAIFDGADNACFSCHRPDLGGLVGPNLTDDHWLHGCGVADLVADIKTGYPLKGMLPFGTGKAMTDEQLLQVASYILSKRGSNPVNPKPIDPDRDKVCR
jgi:cytochrome c oxidase cbb3-type subunit 3